MSELFEKIAIRKFVERVAVSLYEYQGAPNNNERFKDLGSGALFSYGSRLFLVTSDHVLDGTTIEKIVIPDGHEGRTDLIHLRKVRVTRPRDSFLDVAVLEIVDEKTAERLREGWTVITRDMVEECPDDGSFLLLGYPSENRDRQSARADVDHPPLAILTTRILKPPREALDNEDIEPVYDNVDLFFSHRTMGRDDDGSLKPLPRLQGMSGCTVWSYRPADNNKIWTPETHLRAVGIQSGFMTDTYIRAKSWQWAIDAIEHAVSAEKAG